MVLVATSSVKGLLALQIFLFFISGTVDSSSSEALLALPPRGLVAVQGVVYCKSCKYLEKDTLLGASPLQGAVVRLVCNSTKRALTTEGTTDKNGYFYIQPKNVTTYGIHKCKLFLVSSPLQTCKNVTHLNGGITGARLRPEKMLKGPITTVLYTTGPFAFAPNASSCHHY